MCNATVARFLTKTAEGGEWHGGEDSGGRLGRTEQAIHAFLLRCVRSSVLAKTRARPCCFGRATGSKKEVAILGTAERTQRRAMVDGTVVG